MRSDKAIYGEDMTTNRVEELLKENIVMIDTPESLSAEEVARRISGVRRKSGKSIYIAFRAAAACILLVITVGTVLRFWMGGMKGMQKDAQVEEMNTEPSYSYGFSENSGAGADSYDSAVCSEDAEGDSEWPSSTGSEMRDADGRFEPLVLQVSVGDETVLQLPSDCADDVCVSFSDDTGEELCDAEVIYDTDEGYVLVVRGISSGTCCLHVTDSSGLDFVIDVEVH